MQKSFLTMIFMGVIAMSSATSYADTSANANNPALQTPSDSATNDANANNDQATDQATSNSDEVTPDTVTGDDY